MIGGHDQAPPDQAAADREDLEGALLRERPALTSQQVADGAGVTLEEARRLWRALGFPDSGQAVAFTAADMNALRLVQQAVESGAVDLETATRLTRALGNTMARLADWQVSTLAEYVEGQTRRTAGSRLESAVSMAQGVAPVFEELMVYAWRRHLAAAVARVETLGAAEEDLLAAELTVGFADLVSFTQLSNGIGDDALGELVEAFESRCTDVITAAGGRTIKTLGDSVLFVAESASAGVGIALDIVEEIGPDTTLPDVRVGLATGTVINRLGDVYGPPVNLASRLTTVARRNRVITDHVTAAALPPEDFDQRSLDARPLRGFGVVEPVAVRRRSTS
ncbi:MAG: adenylate/guanylate cyclase domain-containing protein [Actinomycetota bacterium]|nr:adenylate/guanylate cyclase domain-containing protein [Actinomycetota bacterium]